MSGQGTPLARNLPGDGTVRKRFAHRSCVRLLPEFFDEALCPWRCRRNLCRVDSGQQLERVLAFPIWSFGLATLGCLPQSVIHRRFCNAFDRIRSSRQCVGVEARIEKGLQRRPIGKEPVFHHLNHQVTVGIARSSRLVPTVPLEQMSPGKPLVRRSRSMQGCYCFFTVHQQHCCLALSDCRAERIIGVLSIPAGHHAGAVFYLRILDECRKSFTAGRFERCAVSAAFHIER